MSTKAIANSGFFTKEFSDDLKKIVQLDSETSSLLIKELGAFSNIQDYFDDVKWIPFLKRTKHSIEDLRAILKPIQFLVGVCADEKISPNELIAALESEGMLTLPGESRSQLIEAVSTLLGLSHRRGVAPRLPLLKIKEISTQCVTVSEFDEEFDVDSILSDYKPKLTGIHPGVTIQMTFHGEHHQPIGIHLTPSNLQTLKKWLEFAEIQLKITKATIEKAVP